MNFITDEHTAIERDIKKEKKQSPVELRCSIETICNDLKLLVRSPSLFHLLFLGGWIFFTDINKNSVVQPMRGRSRCENPATFF